MALIGIVSDSHGEQLRTREALQQLKLAGCEKILHLGDVETFEVLDELASHPVSLVFGNCDYVNRLSDYANSIGLDVQHPVGTLQIGDTGIGYLHGDNLDHYQNLLHDSSIQVVFYGHLHESSDEMVENTRCINPGALHRAARYTVATYDTESGELTFIEVFV